MTTKPTGLDRWSEVRLTLAKNVDVRVRDANGPHFVRAYRDGWKRLPLDVRRTVLDYWQGVGVLRLQLPETDVPGARELSRYSGPAPLVQVAPETDWWWQAWSRAYPNRVENGRFPVAVSLNMGTALMFNATGADAMPQVVLTDVIIHELTHVFLDAKGFDGARGVDLSGATPEAAVEGVADATMKAWGFDPKSVDAWARETGRTRWLEDTPENEAAVLERIRLKGR